MSRIESADARSALMTIIYLSRYPLAGRSSSSRCPLSKTRADPKATQSRRRLRSSTKRNFTSDLKKHIPVKKIVGVKTRRSSGDDGCYGRTVYSLGIDAMPSATMRKRRPSEKAPTFSPRWPSLARPTRVALERIHDEDVRGLDDVMEVEKLMGWEEHRRTWNDGTTTPIRLDVLRVEMPERSPFDSSGSDTSWDAVSPIISEKDLSDADEMFDMYINIDQCAASTDMW